MGAVIRVVVAGSTGSIGRQALEVIAAEPDRYEVVALSAGASVDAIVEQARAVRPRVVAVADAAVADPVARREVAAALDGVEVVDDVAPVCAEADVVVNGVVGFAGLTVTVESGLAPVTLELTWEP
ncbi:MAG: hypothetical protein EBS20_11430 [Actinobacteria bacterium]|nr:hypothetical protein [Actinomycetota bacterium]